jgi:hypothetical protein
MIDYFKWKTPGKAGQSVTEYILIIVMASLAVLGVLQLFGKEVCHLFVVSDRLQVSEKGSVPLPSVALSPESLSTSESEDGAVSSKSQGSKPDETMKSGKANPLEKISGD